jgi:replicative superfamily II helicase
MADRIVIAGTKRAGSRISAIELTQMAGRTGRSQYGPPGIVDLVVEESEIGDIENRLSDDDGFQIRSALSDEKRAGFHLIAEISSKRVTNISEAKKWYGRSFSSFSGDGLDIVAVIRNLESVGAIGLSGYKIFCTNIGRIASSYYFSSEDIAGWKENFDMLFDGSLYRNDVAVAWALSNVPGDEATLYLGKYRCFLDEYLDQIASFGLNHDKGSRVGGLIWWSILGGPSSSLFKVHVKAIRQDFGRIKNALLEINKVAGWNQSEFLDDLEFQVQRGIPNHLISLCRLKGIGKNYAYELYNMGIENVEQISERFSDIEFLEDDGLLSAIEGLLDDR